MKRSPQVSPVWGRMPNGEAMMGAVKWLLPALMLFAVPLGNAKAPTQLDSLTIYVPGVEDGGFDRTAIAVRTALLEEGLVSRVDLIRSPGAAGLVGLAQFTAQRREHPHMVLMGGRSILGGSLFNQSSISLLDTTPIARLNSIVLVIAVRRDSPLKSWSDLEEAVFEDATSVTWVGGSEGSVDDQLVTMVSNALHIPRDRIAYTPSPGGATVIAERVLDGSHEVAVSSYEELAPFLRDGRMRALALSSDIRVEGLSAPTLKEEGVDVSFSDWKGVFAVPLADPLERQRLIDLFAAVARSPAWQKQLALRGWQGSLLTGVAFDDFVRKENTFITAEVARSRRGPGVAERISVALRRPYRVALAAMLIAGTLFCMLLYQRHRSRREMRRLQDSLDDAIGKARADGDRDRKLEDITAHVEAEFARWRLTDAERDIAWLVLKGLSFKEIAVLRNRSERTIRQQAGAIYSKSGLGSRSELSACFLEDLFTLYPKT